MSGIKVGDLVVRKSYGGDLMFRVTKISRDKTGDKNVILRGVDYRIEADSPEEDLKMVSDDEADKSSRQIDTWVRKSIQNIKTKRDKEFLSQTKVPFYRTMDMFERAGKILHMDGAEEFVEKCRDYYNNLGLNAEVVEVPEEEQPLRVMELLKEHNPDILVLTGHDGMVKGSQDYTLLDNYRNSKHFVEAVRQARKYEKSLDNLVIFAGACQSNYEAILDAGANFSSSPKRILINALDPVIVAERVASTGIDRILSINEVVENTNTGFDGIGGVQTRGKARIGGPRVSH